MEGVSWEFEENSAFCCKRGAVGDWENKPEGLK